MNKSALILFLFVTTSLPAQQKPISGKSTIETALKEISNFERNQRTIDSASGRLLGSVKEEDFLRTYNFYQNIYTHLNEVNKSKLLFDDLINLELLQYSIKNRLVYFTYKEYLNPILSDNGFHTQLASIGSSVFTTRKEFENYIARLKDIPRYVSDILNLMRRGLELGIDQPKVILNGYETPTYSISLMTRKNLFSGNRFQESQLVLQMKPGKR